MIKQLFIFLNLLIQLGLFSQENNLILNGDFETFYTLKPQIKNNLDKTFKVRKEVWYSCPIIKSEHWNTVDPQKSFRYCKNKSIAHAGNNCAAIKVYDNIERESNLFTYNNLIGNFKKPLEKDKSYKISFYIKPFIGDFLSNKFEVYVSDTLIQYLAYKEFKVVRNNNKYEVENVNNLEPIFSLKEILKDTNNYKKIEFIYKAKGNERFIYFGNIRGSIPNKIIRTNFGFDPSFKNNNIRLLLIDDISVVEIQDFNFTKPQKNVKEKKKSSFSKKLDLYFESNASILEKKQMAILNRFLLSLRKFSIDSIFIDANCNDIGSKKDNFLLSDKRAKFIKTQLNKYALEYEKIMTIVSNGELELDNKSDIEDQRKINRRVSLIFYYKENEISFKHILFEAGKVKILPQSKETLDSLTLYMQKNISRKIELQGHICCLEFEGRHYVQKYFLSKERAKTIYNFLLLQGIKKERISYKGFEADKKIYQDKIPEHYMNRRVEIILK